MQLEHHAPGFDSLAAQVLGGIQAADTHWSLASHYGEHMLHAAFATVHREACGNFKAFFEAFHRYVAQYTAEGLPAADEAWERVMVEWEELLARTNAFRRRFKYEARRLAAVRAQVGEAFAPGTHKDPAWDPAMESLRAATLEHPEVVNV